LSYKLKKILEFKAKKVLMTDPYVTVDERLSSLGNTVRDSDILIVAAPHKVYKQITTEKPIIDIWNLFGHGNYI
jgi:UDP-N-acetyl-D-mannosaminuronic acid dehydrogenase